MDIIILLVVLVLCYIIYKNYKSKGIVPKPKDKIVEKFVSDKKKPESIPEEKWMFNAHGPSYKGGYVWCGNCMGEIPEPSCIGNRLDLECDNTLV
jgi:hypothetical protein